MQTNANLLVSLYIVLGVFNYGGINIAGLSITINRSTICICICVIRIIFIFFVKTHDTPCV